jgi:plastocyanin
MRKTGVFMALFAAVGVLVALPAAVEVAANREPDSSSREIALRDDCDPTDAAWVPTGGCTLSEGTVSNAEFLSLVTTSLGTSVVGHPSWRFEPSYLVVDAGKRIKISNEGGRTHTFTEVVNFGGGRVPPLNGPAGSLVPAPECTPGAGAVDIPGGGSNVVDGLSTGNHKFQCCIHPWMRTLVKVTDKE